MHAHTDSTAAPDRITYLDAVAGTAAGVDYKRRFVELMDVRPGQTVLDIGCGPGTDLGRLADAVGGGGTVVGVDRDPRMLDEARRRLAGRPTVTVTFGNAHALPLADASVDRARTDRVVQHLADPSGLLAEVRRVLRPGGTLAMAEPDWDTLTVADEDVATSRAFAGFVAGQVRNATIGRQLPRLAEHAGLRARSVEAVAVVFREFEIADEVLGLRRNSARAIRAGGLTDEAVLPWLDRLTTQPFLAAFTFYLVTAQKQRRGGE